VSARIARIRPAFSSPVLHPVPVVSRSPDDVARFDSQDRDTLDGVRKMTPDVIACPSCGGRIPVSELLTEQIRADLEQDFSERLRAEERKLREQADSRLRQERLTIEDKANKAAETRARDAIQRVQQEARGQADMVRNLTAQLEAQKRDVVRR
jgi:hypothetical protein